VADKFQLKAIISAVDKLTPTLKGIQRSVRLTSKTIRDVGGAGGELLTKIGLSTAALTGGLAFSIKKIVDVSSEFERYRTILETIEGSSDKARKSMDWVQDFAVKTPYELNQVTDAFVKLKAYGIEPQNGALMSAGNAAAAMGKDVMQAVEALADAMTGENERLKEFGIKASKAGDTIVYTWTENGKTMAAKAKASSKEMIESTITGIWNRRYGGAMDKLSGTWTGMWSNLMDQITKFTKMIGDSGMFDMLKEQLQGVLKLVDQWEKDGTLKKVAKEISDGLVSTLKELITWMRQVDWRGFVSDVRDIVVGIKDLVTWLGGMKNVLIGVGVILLAGPLGALLSIVGTLWRFGAGMLRIIGGFKAIGTAIMVVGRIFAIVGRLFLLNPIGLVVTAIAAAAYLVYSNWDTIKGWFVDFFTWLPKKIGEVAAWFADLIPDWMREMFSGGASITNNQTTSQISGSRSSVSPVDGASITSNQTTSQTSARSPLLGARTQLNGEMVVRFENAPPGMRAQPGSTNQSGMRMNPDVGYCSLGMAG